MKGKIGSKSAVSALPKAGVYFLRLLTPSQNAAFLKESPIQEDKALFELTQGDFRYILKRRSSKKGSSEKPSYSIIQTNIPKTLATAQEILERYQEDLFIQQACKTKKPRVKEERKMAGDLFLTLLVYKLLRHLKASWDHINLPFAEAINLLATLGGIQICARGKAPYISIPQVKETMKELLDSLAITLPIEP